MPSSEDEPSPSLPIYIPGRRRMCCFQSRDLIESSLYSADMCEWSVGSREWIAVLIKTPEGGTPTRKWI